MKYKNPNGESGFPILPEYCRSSDSSHSLTEAATRGVLWKKVFLEISQILQENTCARFSFLTKLQAFITPLDDCFWFEKHIYLAYSVWETGRSVYTWNKKRVGKEHTVPKETSSKLPS